MLKLILYVITLVASLLSPRKQRIYLLGNKKIKSRKLYWLCVAALLSIFSITTETYTDIGIYTNVFDWTNAGSTNFDNIGWAYLCRLFYFLGFNYRGMIPFIIFFSVWLISRACRKLDVPEESIISLMLLFPGLMNVIQLKFFFATSIIVYSTTFLLRPTDKRYVLRFVLGILFATLIHSASVFCLVFLLAVVFEKIDMTKSILLTLTALMGIMVALKFIPSIASRFLRAEVVSRYFTGNVEASSINWIIEISVAWSLMVIVAWLSIKTNGSIVFGRVDQGNNSQLFLSRGFTIICLIGMTLPLLIFDQNFHRFVEIEYVIGYMIFVYCKSNGKIANNRNKTIMTILLLISIGYSVRYFVTFDRVFQLFSWDGVVRLFR